MLYSTFISSVKPCNNVISHDLHSAYGIVVGFYHFAVAASLFLHLDENMSPDTAIAKVTQLRGQGSIHYVKVLHLSCMSCHDKYGLQCNHIHTVSSISYKNFHGKGSHDVVQMCCDHGHLSLETPPDFFFSVFLFSNITSSMNSEIYTRNFPKCKPHQCASLAPEQLPDNSEKR